MVLVDAVHYRYRAVERIAHLDPVLVGLEGARALVEVEVARPAGPAAEIPATGTDRSGTGPAPPRRPTLDATFLAQVPIQESAPDRYEVRAADVEAVLAHAGRVLAPGVVPMYSVAGGVEYRITSAASDGVLGRQGFTVTAPKLAERAGIELGDTILSVNGVPVDGFVSFFRIYQQVRHTPALATVQVELDRGGTRLTKTYRLR
jgi:membrane-associated protease RseP (regulator of RpoE activity)